MTIVELHQRVELALRVVPDFPIPGVQFRDITLLLADAVLFAEVIESMAARFADSQISHVVAIESRGFMFGVPIAMALRAAFVPVRKPGKLPHRTLREEYSLEYGTNCVEIHADALSAESRVLIVDDVLATGGTIAATVRLVERFGATIVGASVLAEIAALGGRGRLAPLPLFEVVAV